MKIPIGTFIQFLFFLMIVNSFSTELYIFNTTLDKPASIEKSLSGKLGNIDIKVFARFVDLKSMVEKNKPALIIGPEETLKALNLEKKITLVGVYNGSTEEDMFLVSIDNPVDLKTADKLKIGALDISGRSNMASFVAKFLGESAKVKTVTKLEDLIPMLTFKSADAIIVTQSSLDLLKTRTKSKLVSSKIEGSKTGITSVSLDDKTAEVDINTVLKQLKTLNKSELNSLGVQAWK